MDPRITQDVHALSTADLVLVWTLLADLRRTAREAGQSGMAAEFGERLAVIDRELHARQMKLFENPRNDPPKG